MQQWMQLKQKRPSKQEMVRNPHRVTRQLRQWRILAVLMRRKAMRLRSRSLLEKQRGLLSQ